MKTCFINPPWEEGDRSGIRAGCRFPNLTVKNTNSYVPFPFLLAYAATYSARQGVDVCLIDGVAERSDFDSVLRRIGAFSPDLLVAETSTTSLQYDLDLLERIRARHPSTRIAVYGSHVSVRPQDALTSLAVDCVIRGEPEVSSYELAQALGTGQDLSDVAGLVYRTDSGELVQTEPRPLITKIDALPYPMREGLPMDRYSVPGFPSPVVFMYGSRGCPYKCSFCLWPQTLFMGQFRPRAPEAIAEEMAWVLERYPDTQSFFFDDDTFNLGRRRLLRFAEEMHRRRLNIPWGMNARADSWDPELLEKLVATGLFTLRIGVESGDQGVLDRARKDIDLERVRETLEMTHGMGVLNHVSFVVGLPGETWESVENTIRFINSVPVDSVQFSVAIPFPGTEFYNIAEENGFLVTHDWRQYNGFDHTVIRTEAMSAQEIGKALRKMRLRVYFSPRFIKRRLSYTRDLRDFGALTRKVWRLIATASS